jgi:hypothetical protein
MAAPLRLIQTQPPGLGLDRGPKRHIRSSFRRRQTRAATRACRRACSRKRRCHRHERSTTDRGCPQSDQHHSHRHGVGRRCGGRRLRRQLGAAGRKRHRTDARCNRSERQAAAASQRNRAQPRSRRGGLERQRVRPSPAASRNGAGGAGTGADLAIASAAQWRGHRRGLAGRRAGKRAGLVHHGRSARSIAARAHRGICDAAETARHGRVQVRSRGRRACELWPEPARQLAPRRALRR